jgi:hypothetical protein
MPSKAMVEEHDPPSMGGVPVSNEGGPVSAIALSTVVPPSVPVDESWGFPLSDPGSASSPGVTSGMDESPASSS